MTYMYGYPDNYVFSLKNIIPEQISPCDIIEADQSWQRYPGTVIPTTKRNEGPRGYVVHLIKKNKHVYYMYGYPFYFCFSTTRCWKNI